MYINYLNPTHSTAGVASITTTGTTNHGLSGRANQVLLCTTVSTAFYYFSFDNTSAFTAPCTNGAMFAPGNYPLLLNVNHPDQINVLGGATGYLYITEFV